MVKNKFIYPLFIFVLVPTEFPLTILRRMLFYPIEVVLIHR